MENYLWLAVFDFVGSVRVCLFGRDSRSGAPVSSGYLAAPASLRSALAAAVSARRSCPLPLYLFGDASFGAPFTSRAKLYSNETFRNDSSYFCCRFISPDSRFGAHDYLALDYTTAAELLDAYDDAAAAADAYAAAHADDADIFAEPARGLDSLDGAPLTDADGWDDSADADSADADSADADSADSADAADAPASLAAVFSAGFDGAPLTDDDDAPVFSGDNMAAIISSAFGGTPLSDDEDWDDASAGDTDDFDTTSYDAGINYGRAAAAADDADAALAAAAYVSEDGDYDEELDSYFDADDYSDDADKLYDAETFDYICGDITDYDNCADAITAAADCAAAAAARARMAAFAAAACDTYDEAAHYYDECELATGDAHYYARLAFDWALISADELTDADSADTDADSADTDTDAEPADTDADADSAAETYTAADTETAETDTTGETAADINIIMEENIMTEIMDTPETLRAEAADVRAIITRKLDAAEKYISAKEKYSAADVALAKAGKNPQYEEKIIICHERAAALVEEARKLECEAEALEEAAEALEAAFMAEAELLSAEADALMSEAEALDTDADITTEAEVFTHATTTREEAGAEIAKKILDTREEECVSELANRVIKEFSWGIRENL